MAIAALSVNRTASFLLYLFGFQLFLQMMVYLALLETSNVYMKYKVFYLDRYSLTVFSYQSLMFALLAQRFCVCLSTCVFVVLLGQLQAQIGARWILKQSVRQDVFVKDGGRSDVLRSTV